MPAGSTTSVAGLVVALGVTLAITVVRAARARRRRLVRCGILPRRRTPGRPAGRPTCPGVLFLQIDGLAHDVLRRAVRDGNVPTLAGWLAARQPPAHRVEDRLVVADRRQPGRHPARLQPRHAGLPLAREGDRPAAGVQPAAGRRRDRAAPLHRPRPAARRRREPRQRVHRRRRATSVLTMPAPGAGAGRDRRRLLRLLLANPTPRPHPARRSWRGRPRDAPGAGAAPPGRPAAGAARRRLPAAARLHDRRHPRRHRRDADRRHARRALGRLRRLPRLRRGRAPLRRRAATTRWRRCAGSTASSAGWSGPRPTARGRTGSSCSPTTARARARRSATGTARRLADVVSAPSGAAGRAGRARARSRRRGVLGLRRRRRSRSSTAGRGLRRRARCRRHRGGGAGPRTATCCSAPRARAAPRSRRRDGELVLGSGNLRPGLPDPRPQPDDAERIDDALPRPAAGAGRPPRHRLRARPLRAPRARSRSAGTARTSSPPARCAARTRWRRSARTPRGQVARTDGFPHCADIMVNSLWDPQTDEVAAFEELVGSHGGLGGEQTRPFLLYPADLPAPAEPTARGRGGAPAVRLAGWPTSATRRTRRRPTLPAPAPGPARQAEPAV